MRVVDLLYIKPVRRHDSFGVIHSSPSRVAAAVLPMSNMTANSDVVPDMSLIVGPIYIGALAGYCIFGISCVQLYIYYVSFSKENRWIVASVYGVFLADLVHSIAVAAQGWNYAVAGWGRPEHLEYPGWTFSVVPGMSSLVAAWVQIFYAWRIYRFGAWRIVPVTIIFFALAQTGAAWGIGIQYSFTKTVASLHLPSMFARTIIWLGGGSIADLLIMCSMVKLLLAARRGERGIKKTELLINKLIRLSVETGFACVMTAGIELILFLALPNNNLHLFFSSILSKVYGVTLMVNLNSRRTSLWNRPATEDPMSMPTSAFSIAGIQSRQPVFPTVVHVEQVSESSDDSMRKASCILLPLPARC
ncbi:hypothetical protein PENSPDRAFT_439432 [Peniophora sp. CONT]|nr:hypothetical protein PENSPDRAFT_439432 [Peniophora sp. CONT]